MGMSNRPKTSTEYLKLAEDSLAMYDPHDFAGTPISVTVAQVYATMAVAAATVEAGQQVSDVGPAVNDLVKEVRDGLDAIVRSRV